MKAKQIMTRSVHFCRPSSSLGDAAQLGWDVDCGCVPVASDDESGRLVGIVTDRDICMAAHLRGEAPHDMVVNDVVTTELQTASPSQDIAEAEAIMRRSQIRRLPVVDEGTLVGIRSFADLAIEADRKRRPARPPIAEGEVGDTLGAICAPRIPSQLAASA